jgi:hypothetical protein
MAGLARRHACYVKMINLFSVAAPDEIERHPWSRLLPRLGNAEIVV